MSSGFITKTGKFKKKNIKFINKLKKEIKKKNSKDLKHYMERQKSLDEFS